MSAAPRSHPVPVCPACAAPNPLPFYTVDGVPVHSVRLLASRDEALRFPTGDIRLGFCGRCSFITNLAFDPDRLAYASGYESTQAFSPTFERFQRRLAARLVRDFDLRGKKVLEIGCGRGEFLSLLCAAGDNRGVGFDPAYQADPESTPDERVEFVADVYSRAYRGVRADAVCCKMTLEHVRDVAGFVAEVRATIGDRRGALVFFQVPSAERILRRAAFWDVYYEHCSYFTAEALAALFEANGFRTVEQWTDYDDQYRMLAARADGEPGRRPRAPASAAVKALVETFAARSRERVERWRAALEAETAGGRRLVVWGAGSKAVSFLHALGLGERVACLVDVNPRKHGTFLAGSGHPIVAPEALREVSTDAVVVMNPIYRAEIAGDLRRLGLAPRLVVLEA
jgi:SAM-dependent methyltransferase